MACSAVVLPGSLQADLKIASPVRSAQVDSEIARSVQLTRVDWGIARSVQLARVDSAARSSAHFSASLAAIAQPMCLSQWTAAPQSSTA